MSEHSAVPADLRQVISDEMNEAITYEGPRHRLVMHPSTFALLDNVMPPAIGDYELTLDASLKVGSFMVE